jgi:hypothetical protein
VRAKIVQPTSEPETRENSDKREGSKLAKVRGEGIEVRRKIRANQIYLASFSENSFDTLNSTIVGKVILQAGLVGYRQPDALIPTCDAPKPVP